MSMIDLTRWMTRFARSDRVWYAKRLLGCGIDNVTGVPDPPLLTAMAEILDGQFEANTARLDGAFEQPEQDPVRLHTRVEKVLT